MPSNDTTKKTNSKNKGIEQNIRERMDNIRQSSLTKQIM